MIMIAVAAMLAGADPGAEPIHNFIQCLRQAVSDAKSQKVAPDGFVAFARQHCASAEAPYKSSVISADVQHGMSHKEAISDAASLADSYYSERLDDYKVGYKPPEQATATAAPAVATPPPTPAAQPK